MVYTVKHFQTNTISEFWDTAHGQNPCRLKGLNSIERVNIIEDNFIVTPCLRKAHTKNQAVEHSTGRSQRTSWGQLPPHNSSLLPEGVGTLSFLPSSVPAGPLAEQSQLPTKLGQKREGVGWEAGKTHFETLDWLTYKVSQKWPG